MYSLTAILFFLLVLLIVASFLGRLGTDGVASLSGNVASAIALLITYAFLLVGLSSYSELSAFFEGICGGVPFLKDISDYGSLEKVFTQSPLTAAASFMDTVILATLIDILMPLPKNPNSMAKQHLKDNFMVGLFTGVVVAIISLLLLNYLIKPSSAYQWVISIVGGIISIISIGSIPAQILSLFKDNTFAGVGLSAVLYFLSKSWIVGILRSAFFQAIVYVLGIWILEKNFGSIANGLSWLSAIAVVAGPIIIMLIGLSLILKSARL